MEVGCGGEVLSFGIELGINVKIWVGLLLGQVLGKINDRTIGE